MAGTDTSQLTKFCESQTKIREGADEDKTSYQIIECLVDAWPDKQDEARFHLSTIVSLLRGKEVYTDTKKVGDILRNMELEVKQVRAGAENKNLTGAKSGRRN